MTTIIESIKNIKTLDTRPDWDDYFILTACLISKRSTCRKLHVGCVIVKDNRIITTGYNGHIPNTSHTISITRDGHEMSTIHAEINAICDASKRGVPINDSIAYVTHYPCVNCCKSLIASGIKEVVYESDYNNDEISKQLFEIAGVKVRKY